MSVCINYPNTARFVRTTVDKYGGPSAIADQADVPCAIQSTIGAAHGANQDAITSDTVLYVDPASEFVQDNYYRLEEMLVIINVFAEPFNWEWYKVINVNVARDHQLCNDIDNIEVQLKKTKELPNYVS